MKTIKLCSRALAVSSLILISPAVLAQDMSSFEYPGVVNLIGLGIAAAPDFYGSSDNEGVILPIARYNFGGRWGENRYVQLFGPELLLNLSNQKEFRAGPVLRVRARRDDDVDDEIVKQMRPVASTTELGAFAEYHMYLSPPDQFHKVVFAGDIVANTTDTYNGTSGNLRVNYFHPFPQSWTGRRTIGSIGLGMFFASGSFNTAYFGVTGSDVALFPSLGGTEYRPDSGVTSVKIPFSVTTQIDKKWLLTVGGRFERLLGDAKDSPVVEQRGDANQWALGVAASYLF